MDGAELTLEFVRVEEGDDPGAFRLGVQEYLLRGEDGTYAPATLRWDDALLELLARARAREPAATQALGEALRRFLAGPRLAALERALATSDDSPVRLVIAAAAAELHALPWELLTLGNGRHVGELPRVEVVYRWPGARPADDLRPPAREGGRILLAWSRALGNVGERHTLDAIAGAAAAADLAFDPARDVAESASLPAIVAALEAGAATGAPVTLLHILCHGAAHDAGFGLGLDDGRGGRQVVDAGTLRRALAPFAGHLRAVLVMACDGGNAGAPGVRLGSVAHELHRAGIAAVLAPRYPVSGAGALELTRHVYTVMLSESGSIEQAFHLARQRLVRGGSPDWAAFQLHRHAGPGVRPFVVRPYRGLLAFERQHAALFFGREAELAETLRDLDALIAGGRPRLLAVAGASGTGKSSLVLAAVRVALAARGWHVAVMRPGRDPGLALAEALRARPSGRDLVLVVDQFEEVFTHDAADVPGFARALWALATRPDDRVAVILTIRVDFVGRCGELVVDDQGTRLDRVVYDEAHRVFVAQMAPDSLRAAIEGPAGRVGLRVEPGLAERLIRDVSSENNALPLLEYVLDELWRRRERDVLTHAALDAAGGVDGALSRHADAVLAGLDDAARVHARRALVRLVRFGSDPSSGVRHREEAGALRSRRDPAGWDRAVDALIAARLLLRREAEGAGATLEIAHEAVIRHWDRLWGWYQTDRDRLARRHDLDRLLEQWRQYGPLQGKALAYAQELAAALDDDDVPDEARRMLAASAARERDRVRLRRGLVGAALAASAAFAIVVSVLGLRASASAERADLAARRAHSASRVAAAERFLDDRPHLGAALLRGVDPSESVGWSAAAFRALQAVLPEVTSVAGMNLRHLAFAPDGALIAATADDDSGLRVLPARGEPGPATPGSGLILTLAAAPIGDLVFVHRAGRLEAWQRDGVRLTRRAEAPLAKQYVAALVPGARTPRVVVRGEGEQTSWELVGDRLELRATRAPCERIEPATELALCRDGDRVTVETWTGEVVARSEAPTDAPGLPVWYWAGDASPPTQRALLQDRWQRVEYIHPLADQTVFVGFQNSFMMEDSDLCAALPGGAGGMKCAPLASGCNFEAVLGREILIQCPDRLSLRRVENPRLVQDLRGPEPGTLRGVVTDASGRVAALDDDEHLWRWTLEPRASGVSVVGNDWTAVSPLGYLQVPHLQAERARVVGVLWASPRIDIAVWTLDPQQFPEFAPPRTHAIPIPETVHAAPLYALAGDFVLVYAPGEAGATGSYAVATLHDQRIDARTLAAASPPQELVALAADGESALVRVDGKFVRIDLRGERAVERPVPGEHPGTIVAVDPRVGRAVYSGTDLPLGLLDLTTGATTDLSPVLRLAGGAPDAASKLRVAAFDAAGERVALGDIDGALVLLRLDDLERPQHLPRQHRMAIAALRFADDGARLFSADEAGKVVVWQDLAAERSPRISVLGPSDVSQVGLSADRSRLWAINQSGALFTWTLVEDPAAAARELAARATYCLTDDEWTRHVGVAPDEADALARAECPPR